jgi:membrane peptidoglycan carboxypeptidase
MGAVKVQERSRRGTRIVRRVLLAAAGVVVVLFVAGAVYLVTLPGVGDAQLRARQIMLAHGESVAALPTPPKLVDSVISVEDEHFYNNVVVNVLTGAGRAALAALQTSQDPGGSTIDQQLAKQLYGHGEGVGSTLREIGLGVKLALHYSKRQILQMYLNVVYYGHGYWGVQQAAQGYFHTAPAQLTWAEASMLAGLLQAPSAYDPLAHYALGRQRQRHVLTQLVVNHHLTSAQATAIYAAGVPLG